jgi:hypothetical protein
MGGRRGRGVRADRLAARGDERRGAREAVDESELVHRHAELGETFFWFALAFFLTVLALMLWDAIQRRRSPALTPRCAPAAA